MFMPFDRVQYVGSKLAQQVKNLSGEVISRVGNETGSLVVEFGDHSYIVSEKSLRRYIPSKEDKEAEVVRKRRRDPDLE